MPIIGSLGAATAKSFGFTKFVSSSSNNPTRTDFPTAGRAVYTWNLPLTNTTYEIPPGWTYTFPANTPTGWFYLVVWNDYNSSNTSPTASTTYRTRRVFSLQVVSSYDFAARVATSTPLATITGSSQYEYINGIIITNTTRSQEMANVVPGTTVDIQYVGIPTNNSSTIMVVPGDTITISVNLKGPYTEFSNWTHNAE